MESKIIFFINYMSTVKRASRNTLESYRRDLEAMKEYFYAQGITDISKINNTNINSYVLYMEQNGKSSATIARSISTIKTFFRCMINNGHIRREPTENVNVPQIQHKKTEIIDKESIKLMLEGIGGKDMKNMRDRAMLELIYDTGIKVSELINLRLADINLDYSYVTCRGVKKDKTVPFGWQTNKAVTTYLQLARDKFVKDNSVDFLFLNRFGKQMTRQGFWKTFKKYAENAGLKEMTTHEFHKKRN